VQFSVTQLHVHPFGWDGKSIAIRWDGFSFAVTPRLIWGGYGVQTRGCSQPSPPISSSHQPAGWVDRAGFARVSPGPSRPLGICLVLQGLAGSLPAALEW